MKVKELISLLYKVHNDAEVFFSYNLSKKNVEIGDVVEQRTYTSSNDDYYPEKVVVLITEKEPKSFISV